MADEFVIESRTANTIKVRHLAHGHRYTFHVKTEASRRILRVGLGQRNRKASLPITAFETAARTFAEREATKAGLID
ncbi:hypothetical protein SAMN05444161_9157 [Rhizobiales bacterium GAS191]|nr:hypothetical protein SAMN05444161_9157 [Rhizobiales bacterium GAS191]